MSNNKSENTAELLEEILKNPHFKALTEVLAENNVSESTFMKEFEKLFLKLISNHKGDNDVLKKESHYYILPAISVYETMKKHMPEPLSCFRKMWFSGAEYGAKLLRERAQDEKFLSGWCRNITPKEENAGAFVFDIKSVSDTHTEYHVLECPYVRLCKYYGCSEIVTVFCDSDDISFRNINPRLIWERTQTIGRGDSVCDFAFTYIKKG